MPVRGLHRDAERLRHLLGQLAAGQQGQHLALPVGQAVRAIEAWHLLAGRLGRGSDGVGIETTCRRLGGEGLHSLLGRHARAVRTLLALRVEHVRRGEQPGRHGQLCGGHAPVVTGPVQTLVVSGRDRHQASQEGGVRQHRPLPHGWTRTSAG